MAPWMIQAAGTEGYDCKTIIGVLGGLVAAMGVFITKMFMARIKDLKDANRLAETLLDVAEAEIGKKQKEADGD